VVVECCRLGVAMDFITKEHTDCVDYVEGDLSTHWRVVESSTKQLGPKGISRVSADHHSIWTGRLKVPVREVRPFPEFGWGAQVRIYSQAREDESEDSIRTGVRLLDVVQELRHMLSGAHLRPRHPARTAG
jgi:hypothetical protein